MIQAISEKKKHANVNQVKDMSALHELDEYSIGDNFDVARQLDPCFCGDLHHVINTKFCGAPGSIQTQSEKGDEGTDSSSQLAKPASTGKIKIAWQPIPKVIRIMTRSSSKMRGCDNIRSSESEIDDDKKSKRLGPDTLSILSDHSKAKAPGASKNQSRNLICKLGPARLPRKSRKESTDNSRNGEYLNVAATGRCRHSSNQSSFRCYFQKRRVHALEQYIFLREQISKL